MKSISLTILAVLVLAVSIIVVGCQSSDSSMTGPTDQVSVSPLSMDPTNAILGGKGDKSAAPKDTSRYAFAR
jgi:hypothetical protein